MLIAVDSLRTTPLRAFANDVLPAPFGPSTASTVPGSIVTETGRSAVTSPYRTRRSITSTRAGAPGFVPSVSGRLCHIMLVLSPIWIDRAGRLLAEGAGVRILTEVRHAQRVRAEHLVWRPLGDHLAEVDRDHSIGHQLGEFEIVFDHQ